MELLRGFKIKNVQVGFLNLKFLKFYSFLKIFKIKCFLKQETPSVRAHRRRLVKIERIFFNRTGK